MNRIENKFRELKRKNKKAFIAFITAGYPDLKITYRLVLEFSRIGVDIVELGVPFSDPIADGPVIEDASQYALRKKVNLNGIFNIVKKLRRHTQIPVCLMTYYNPVFCFGEEKFLHMAKNTGVDGVIIPDLPPEEAMPLIKTAKESGVSTIFFVSPTTDMRRMKLVVKKSTGFIYYVSLTGTTGVRRKLPLDLKANIAKIKKMTSKPVCVGFGVSSPFQVKGIQKIADGVIVGSAIVKKIKENMSGKNLTARVGGFVKRLKSV